MDIFECSICLEEFKDPVVISCGHTFCKGCLLELKQLQCPTCRKNFESVMLLPSNFVVLQWMEENKNDKNKKKFIQCENCEEEKEAVIWCENCVVYYCGDCEKNIHSGKATRSHVRLSLNEKKKKPSFSKCENHMEENKFYCLNCHRLICNVCVVDDHPQHRTMSIFKYAETLKNDLNTSLSDMVECIDLFKRKEEKFGSDIKKKRKR
jgi:ribosomal protein L35AE/L33A